MQTNPFIKPIISKHNKSPLLGGKINTIKIKSLNGLRNPIIQSFKNQFLDNQKMMNPFKYENYSNINNLVYEYMQPMATPFAPIGGHVIRPRIPFLEKASSGAKVIRAKSEKEILTPYHPNKRIPSKLPNWKNV